jgi:hypothetical protein
MLVSAIDGLGKDSGVVDGSVGSTVQAPTVTIDPNKFNDTAGYPPITPGVNAGF